MGDFISYCETNYVGIFICVGLIFCAGLFFNWIMWMFSWGRYNQTSGLPSSKDGKLMFVFADFFVKIINDFRNLLALVLVLIFATALVYALVESSGSEDLSKSLQAVMSTLGGLVGSIVGYYFGESKAKSNTDSGQGTNPSIPISTNPPTQQTSDKTIKTVPPPANLDNKKEA